jgi:hypothetical protein
LGSEGDGEGEGGVDEIEEVERMLMANDVTVHPDEEDEELMKNALAVEEGEDLSSGVSTSHKKSGSRS